MLRDLEQPVVCGGGRQHAVRCRLDDPGPRVEVLVDAVAKARELELVVGVLGLVDVLLHVAAVVGDALQGANHRLIGATVQRSPQR